MTQWKAWKMWKGCGRKSLRFPHEGQAHREAHKRGMAAYRCRFCDHWHLTSRKDQ